MISEGRVYSFDVDTEHDVTRIGIITEDKDTRERKVGVLHAHKAAILESEARFILLVSGKGGGKTITGPPWLYQEILKRPGGPYLAVGPDKPRMALQFIPYIEDFFDNSPLRDPEGKGVHLEKNILVYNLGMGYGTIYLIAADTHSDVRKIESIHPVAILFDEGGQTVNEIWDALRARSNQKRARILITTTAYKNTGYWLKEFYDRAEVNKWRSGVGYERVKEGDPDWAIFRFRSEDNPEFDVESLEAERQLLAADTYEMYYGGAILQVQGTIFKTFSRKAHVATADNRVAGLTEADWWSRINSPLAKGWPRMIGHDRGFGHPATDMFLVYDPLKDKLVVAYEQYLEGDDVDDHLKYLAEINQRFVHKFTKCQYPLDGAEDVGLANEVSRNKSLGIHFLKAQDDKELEKLFRSLEVSNERVNGLVYHDRIVFLGSRTPRVIEEMPRYRRDPVQSRWGEQLQVVRKRDDGICALRYGLLGMLWDIRSAQMSVAKEAKAKPRSDYSKVIPAYDPTERKKTKKRLVKPLNVRKLIKVTLR